MTAIAFLVGMSGALALIGLTIIALERHARRVPQRHADARVRELRVTTWDQWSGC